jgi:uncharacterized protein (DUF1919 family)
VPILVFWHEADEYLFYPAVTQEENFDLEEAYSCNLSPKDKRDIKQIIYEHFEYIEEQWDEFQRRRQG